MRFIVLGASGYLGSETCRAMLDAGHSVVSIDVRPPVVLGDMTSSVPFTTVCAEVLSDPGAVRRHLLGADAVVHLAAISSDRACAAKSELVEQFNVAATHQLARMALEEGIDRFVFASTSAVYGTGRQLVEEAIPRPLTPYAASKVRAEDLLLTLVDEGLQPVILRLGTLYGRSDSMRYDLVVNAMVQEARERAQVTLNGTGEQWRPLVGVSDAAQAMMWAATRAGDNGGTASVFNVGGPDANIRVRDVAEHVLSQFPGAVLRRRPDLTDGDGYSVDVQRLSRAWGQHRWSSVQDGIRTLRESDQRTATARNPGEHLFHLPARERDLTRTGRRVPLALPDIGVDDEAAVLTVLRSGWLTTGARVEEFETALARLTGAAHVVAVSSCTAALHLSLLAAGIGAGDEVITTPITWPATANVVEHVGAVPVFADVNPRTLNLEPGSVLEHVTNRTRAILPVHMAGVPVELEALQSVARGCGAVIIEDAAHALGATSVGKPIGSHSRFTCFSFYPTKTITTIEGGALALSEESDALLVRVLANHGMTSGAWSSHSGSGGQDHFPRCVAAGYKYNLPDVGAALGVEQLRRLPAFLRHRERLVLRYRAKLADVPGVVLPDLPPIDSGTQPSYHLMAVLLDRVAVPGHPRHRDTVVHQLRLAGVGAGIHYRSLHLQPYYRHKYALSAGDLPGAASVSERVLSLPLHCRMNEEDVDHVVAVLRQVLAVPQSDGPSCGTANVPEGLAE